MMFYRDCSVVREMAIYEEFADFYARGQYCKFSEQIAELLPSLLERFGAKPRNILDIACGEGAFAVAMAKKGYAVTEVDQSARMLHFAKERAVREGVKIEFLLQDMRSLSLTEKFDLVTCWYDSLNYLLSQEELEKTFKAIYRAMNPGGFFIFDMNTVYCLAVKWQRQRCIVEQSTPELFEIHQLSYDTDSSIATMKITGFKLVGDAWTRIDEEHRERGYTLEQIRESLEKAELKELACFGNLRELTEPKPDTSRLLFVVRK